MLGWAEKSSRIIAREGPHGAQEQKMACCLIADVQLRALISAVQRAPTGARKATFIQVVTKGN